jgi:hypothetical protein
MMKRFLPVVALALTAGAAEAVVDVTAVTDAVDSALTAGTTIGLAVLGMIAGIKLFKWVRRAM